jgi:hypothetical protein
MSYLQINNFDHLIDTVHVLHNRKQLICSSTQLFFDSLLFIQSPSELFHFCDEIKALISEECDVPTDPIMMAHAHWFDGNVTTRFSKHDLMLALNHWKIAIKLIAISVVGMNHPKILAYLRWIQSLESLIEGKTIGLLH